MPDELVGQDSAHIAQSERVIRVLQHAPMTAAQDVREVLAPVGANPRDVRVQPGLPAAIAGTSAELEQEFAVTGLPTRSALLFAQTKVQPRLPADILQVGTHPLDVDRRAGDQEDCRDGLVHGSAMLPSVADEPFRRRDNA